MRAGGKAARAMRIADAHMAAGIIEALGALRRAETTFLVAQLFSSPSVYLFASILAR